MDFEKFIKTRDLIKEYGQGPYASHNVELLNYSSKIQKE
jgi:hypothetical protein